jgi:hypothetical protein
MVVLGADAVRSNERRSDQNDQCEAARTIGEVARMIGVSLPNVGVFYV